MKTEQAKKITEQAIERLSEALSAGRSETLTAYLRAVSHFHRYSFTNVMLIWSQNPEATRVAGFGTWKKLRRSVRRGEKGIAIVAPVPIKPGEDEPAGQEADGEEREQRLRFRIVHVFDVSQTEGEPLPEFERVGGDPGEHTERLESFIRSRGIRIERDEHLSGADGVSRGGTIVLRSCLSTAEHFSVLVHELAHEMLHRDPERRPASRTVRETEAEAVAFVVTHAIGLATGTAASDYIQLYNGDTETLTASLDRIQQTSAAIIEALSGADGQQPLAEQPDAGATPEEVRPCDAGDRRVVNRSSRLALAARSTRSRTSAAVWPGPPPT